MTRSALVFFIIVISTITFISVFYFLKVIFSPSVSRAQSGQGWSRIGLVLAMAGNAVGFGNFLRFPVQAVQNGGGAFIIPYLVCFLLMGIPLLLIEWSIGRYGGRWGNHSTPFMLGGLSKGSVWKYVGVFGIFSNIGIAAYYCFMESWTIAYTVHSATGTFNGLSHVQVEQVFTDYIDPASNTLFPHESLVFFVICLALNVLILSYGLRGIEKVAKTGMPLLIVFGLFLAIRSVTLKAGEHGAVNNGVAGLDFLWTPVYDSLWNPKVWLAAAGQIFFTLSVGMGSIQCYASFLGSRDDIALNSMAAGWMNEFVEVVIGAAIIIPVAIGFLGIDRVKEVVEMGGLALGFKTLPYLFSQYGNFFSVLAGTMWFLLLFFAGITSSVAMGKPVISFLVDEFSWTERRSAIAFGIVVLILGLPTVLFFNYGVFDQYDYWAGTVSLFVFAMLEVILFAWVFGIRRGWAEITAFADIRVPGLFRWVIAYITPVILILVFLGALVNPAGGDWHGAVRSVSEGHGWPLDGSSIIRQLTSYDIRHQISEAVTAEERSGLELKLHLVNGTKIILLSLFAGISLLVFIASRKRERLKAGNAS